MAEEESLIIRDLNKTLRAAQEVMAEWLEPGVLTAEEAKDSLLQLLDNPRIVAIQAEADVILTEQVEEAFG